MTHVSNSVKSVKLQMEKQNNFRRENIKISKQKNNSGSNRGNFII